MYYEVGHDIDEAFAVFREGNELRKIEIEFHYDIDPRDKRYDPLPDGDIHLLEMLGDGFDELQEVVIGVEKDLLMKEDFDVWDCHDRASYTKRVYRDIPRVLGGILGKDMVRVLEGDDRAFGWKKRCLTFKKQKSG